MVKSDVIHPNLLPIDKTSITSSSNRVTLHWILWFYTVCRMTCIHPPLKSRIHRIWFRQHCKSFLGLPLKSYITVLVLSHFLVSLDRQSLSVSIVLCPSMLICLFSIICHGANGSESWSASQLCGITQSRWWIYLTKTWYSSALFRAQGRLMF